MHCMIPLGKNQHFAILQGGVKLLTSTVYSINILKMILDVSTHRWLSCEITGIGASVGDVQECLVGEELWVIMEYLQGGASDQHRLRSQVSEHVIDERVKDFTE